MIRRLLLLLTALLLIAPAASAGADTPEAPAPPAWQAEFDAVCAKTPDVMHLSREELQRLVAECDRLKPLVESLPESPRKVYRRRLEMSRNLFLFTLEAKEAETPPPPR